MTTAGPSPREVFQLRCWARARLWREGMIELADAVDVLQQAAVASGLVEALGQDVVQGIMAAAFDPPAPAMVPDALIEAPAPRGAVAESTLRAAEYLVREGNPTRLRAWLAAHDARERVAIYKHLNSRRRSNGALVRATG